MVGGWGGGGWQDKRRDLSDSVFFVTFEVLLIRPCQLSTLSVLVSLSWLCEGYTWVSLNTGEHGNKDKAESELGHDDFWFLKTILDNLMIVTKIHDSRNFRNKILLSWWYTSALEIVERDVLILFFFPHRHNKHSNTLQAGRHWITMLAWLGYVLCKVFVTENWGDQEPVCNFVLALTDCQYQHRHCLPSIAHSLPPGLINKDFWSPAFLLSGQQSSGGGGGGGIIIWESDGGNLI